MKLFVGLNFSGSFFVPAGPVVLGLGGLLQLIRLLPMVFRHRAVALRLRFPPADLTLTGDPSTFSHLPDGEQQHRHDNHCDHDDHDC